MFGGHMNAIKESIVYLACRRDIGTKGKRWIHSGFSIL